MSMMNIKTFIRHCKNGIAYAHASAKQSLAPKNLFIILTYRCNSRCIMCNIWKKKPEPEMTKIEWENILKDPIFQKIENLDLTGGEALLVPEITDFIQLFIRHMPHLINIHIVTNGLTPSYIEQKIKKITKICRQHNIALGISVSLDAIGKEHETIRGVPNAFKKTAKTIALLQKAQQTSYFKLTIGSLLLRQTLHKTKKIQTWTAHRRLQQHFQITDYSNFYFCNTKTKQKTSFLQSEKQYISTLYHSLSKQSFPHPSSYYWEDMSDMVHHNTTRSSPCSFLYDQFAIDALGNMYICLFDKPIGNIRKTASVSSLYFSLLYTKRKIILSEKKCLRCVADCNTSRAIAYDLKKYIWFFLTRKPWHGIAFLKKEILKTVDKK